MKQGILSGIFNAAREKLVKDINDSLATCIASIAKGMKAGFKYKDKYKLIPNHATGANGIKLRYSVLYLKQHIGFIEIKQINRELITEFKPNKTNSK